VAEHSLRPWSNSTQQLWLEEIGLIPGDPDGRQRVTEVTGNWSLLLHAVGARCKSEPHKWREHLTAFSRDLVVQPEWRQAIGIPQGAIHIIRMMAELDVPISVDDFTALEPDLTVDHVERVLRWADVLSLVRKESQAKWKLDPVVRRLVGEVAQ
jgi:hypothetical protein